MIDLLSAFYFRACSDNRLSPSHLSLYVALLLERGGAYEWRSIDKVRIMQLAKICSRVTYHKVIRELFSYGYIEYRPSYEKGKTMVRVVSCEM